MFNQYGLNEIWDEQYSAVGVKHISAGSWDPCHFATKDPIRSLADLKGKRVFTFPTAGRFLSQFGVVPVTLPWEDIEVAVQTVTQDRTGMNPETSREGSPANYKTAVVGIVVNAHSPVLEHVLTSHQPDRFVRGNRIHFGQVPNSSQSKVDRLYLFNRT